MELTTHYTGIGSEIREDAINNATKVVVNLPQGLGRYDIEDASNQYVGIDPEHLAGYIPSAKFEWYLKNHLGSTMLVYGTQSYDDLMKPNFVGLKSAYDYRAFGEQVDLTILFNDKVTETFTGKEKDDETELSNHGARMLDPMLGLWIAVDPERFFSSPYLYMGNGYNPIRFVDLNGERPGDEFNTPDEAAMDWGLFTNPISKTLNVEHFAFIYRNSNGKFVSANPTMTSVDAFSLKDMQRNRFENPHLESFEPVAMIHTHGENNFFGYPDGYDNDNFSSEDISTSNFLELNLYLFNPTDELKLHDFESKEIKTIDQGNMLE